MTAHTTRGPGAARPDTQADLASRATRCISSGREVKWKRLLLAVHTNAGAPSRAREGVHAVVLLIMIKNVGTMIASLGKGLVKYTDN